jgi:hypothetical protein
MSISKSLILDDRAGGDILGATKTVINEWHLLLILKRRFDDHLPETMGRIKSMSICSHNRIPRKIGYLVLKEIGSLDTFVKKRKLECLQFSFCLNIYSKTSIGVLMYGCFHTMNIILFLVFVQ